MLQSWKRYPCSFFFLSLHNVRDGEPHCFPLAMLSFQNCDFVISSRSTPILCLPFHPWFSCFCPRCFWRYGHISQSNFGFGTHCCFFLGNPLYEILAKPDGTYEMVLHHIVACESSLNFAVFGDGKYSKYVLPLGCVVYDRSASFVMWLLVLPPFVPCFFKQTLVFGHFLFGKNWFQIPKTGKPDVVSTTQNTLVATKKKKNSLCLTSEWLWWNSLVVGGIEFSSRVLRHSPARQFPQVSSFV